MIDKPEKYIFAITAGLLFFPYLLFKPSALFPIALIYSPLEHALAAAVLLAALGLSFFIGAQVGRINRPYVFELSVSRGVYLKYTLWMLTILSVSTQIYQLWHTAPVYLSGDFNEARAVLEVPGIGVPLRLYIVSFPMLLALYRPQKKLAMSLLVFIGSLNVLRAISMSERNAVIEFCAVLLAFLFMYRIRLEKVHVVAGMIVLYLFFAAILADRLRAQGNQGAHGGQFSSSISAYYADTMNKYYLTSTGLINKNLAAASALAPVYELISMVSGDAGVVRSQGVAFWSWRNQRYFTSEGLNNPGGLAQDINDFGFFLGHIVMVVKFLLFGFVIVRARTNRYFFSFLPTAIISMLEYPRFNYLGLPFAFYVFTVGQILWLLRAVLMRPGRVAPVVQGRALNGSGIPRTG